MESFIACRHSMSRVGKANGSGLRQRGPSGDGTRFLRPDVRRMPVREQNGLWHRMSLSEYCKKISPVRAASSMIGFVCHRRGKGRTEGSTLNRSRACPARTPRELQQGGLPCVIEIV